MISSVGLCDLIMDVLALSYLNHCLCHSSRYIIHTVCCHNNEMILDVAILFVPGIAGFIYVNWLWLIR